jgi:hypothetical protein
MRWNQCLADETVLPSDPRTTPGGGHLMIRISRRNALTSAPLRIVLPEYAALLLRFSDGQKNTVVHGNGRCEQC